MSGGGERSSIPPFPAEYRASGLLPQCPAQEIRVLFNKALDRLGAL